eukprot:5246494-Pleurochrysis_carterae.AAC.1
MAAQHATARCRAQARARELQQASEFIWRGFDAASDYAARAMRERVPVRRGGHGAQPVPPRAAKAADGDGGCGCMMAAPRLVYSRYRYPVQDMPRIIRYGIRLYLEHGDTINNPWLYIMVVVMVITSLYYIRNIFT